MKQSELFGNPAKRTPRGRSKGGLKRPSQSTGEAPSSRLLKRRRKTVAAPRGFFANPGARKPAGYRSVYVDTRDGGFEYGMDAVTPVRFLFSVAKNLSAKRYAWTLPDSVWKSPDFQAWARGANGGVICSLNELKQRLRLFAGL